MPLNRDCNAAGAGLGEGWGPVIREDKRPLDLRMVGLAAMCAALLAFSVAWYGTLAGMDCSIAKSTKTGHVGTGSGDDLHNCGKQLQYHWIKFYGINALIYGVLAFAFFATARRKKVGLADS